MALYKIGMLGAARITPKAIIQPAGVIPAVELHGVAARQKSRADTYAKEHNIAQVYDTYLALVTAPEIDIIYNPLAPSDHAEWSIKALEAGKHVLCEKPFAMNSSEAKRMVEAAKASGKRLVEAFHYCYHPAFIQLLDWVHAGEIGDVEHIDACFNVAIRNTDDELRQQPIAGGGAMMDLGCYALNFILQIMQQAPREISAHAHLTQRGVDESMQAELQFANGATATIETNMAEGTPYKSHLTVSGSKGQVNFDSPVAPYRDGSLTLINDKGTTTAPINRITTYTYQLTAMIEAIETGARLPSEGAMILLQQQVLDGIYEAAGLRALRWG